MYKFTKDKTTGTILYNSKKYKVSVLRAQGYLYVIISGPGFKRRGLTNIKDSVTDFEMKVVALVYARQAKMYGENMGSIEWHNYADIFGSTFD